MSNQMVFPQALPEKLRWVEVCILKKLGAYYVSQCPVVVRVQGKVREHFSFLFQWGSLTPGLERRVDLGLFLEFRIVLLLSFLYICGCFK